MGGARARRSAARLLKRTRENASKEGESRGTAEAQQEKVASVLERKTPTVPKKNSAKKFTGLINSTNLSLSREYILLDHYSAPMLIVLKRWMLKQPLFLALRMALIGFCSSKSHGSSVLRLL